MTDICLDQDRLERHNTQHNDIQHNDIQHNDIQHINHSHGTLSIMAERCNAVHCLNGVSLTLSVTHKIFILSVIMLNVVKLSVEAPKIGYFTYISVRSMLKKNISKNCKLLQIGVLHC